MLSTAYCVKQANVNKTSLVLRTDQCKRRFRKITQEPILWQETKISTHPLVHFDFGVPKEGHGRAAAKRSVRNVLLLGQVLGVLDRRDHAFDCEEGRKVGRVGRDDDQGEEPPNAADDPRWGRFWVEAGALEQGTLFLPFLF